MITAAALSALMMMSAASAPIPGEAAPDFTEPSASGAEVSLADFAGKTVVLEWTNHDCPFVRKHYNSDNMQSLQRRAAAEDVVWLTVISSAPGKQGHVSAVKANELTSSRGAEPAYVLLDEDGSMGRAYGAKTTPHMYIIDDAGLLRYAGAIDTIPSADPADLPNAQNYVSAALGAMADGEEVVTTLSAPYGCSVKY
ncbi:MAG: redoxin family protein [Pseudomonadota bacterium]